MKDLCLTRFAILPDERRLLLGKDMDNVFKSGVVYEVRQFDGEYIIKEIGEYALSKTRSMFESSCELSDVSNQITYGLYLITKKEYEEILKDEQEHNE